MSDGQNIVIPAHILCPGPSLPRTAQHLIDQPDAGLVIAVNRAANFAPYHWLSCGDRHGLTTRLPDGTRLIERVPRRGILTFADACRGILDRDDPDEARFHGLRCVQWDDLPEPDGPIQWSVIAALLLAHTLGSTELHLYGCDQHGLHDWDGSTYGGRDADRWTRERADLTRAIAYLRRHGVTVHHHHDAP